jgi:hypothetical protein
VPPVSQRAHGADYAPKHYSDQNLNFPGLNPLQTMAASCFVEVSDKEINEIKMNADQKNTKKLVQKY